MEKADAIIIGSGQGGVPLAVKLARQGKNVVLFEKGSLGGTCLNHGCYPSKAFLGAAHTAGAGRNAADWGIDMVPRIDFSRLMEKVRSKRDSSYIKIALDKAGVRTISASASFTEERTVTGGGVTIEAPVVVINTGNAPFVPPVPGLDGTPYLTYLNFWDLDELPPRILIVGGGYIGVELGQGIAQLGSETHIIELTDRIVAREEPELSDTIQAALEADGVSFHLGRKAEKVDYADEIFTLSLDNGDELKAEALLMVVGQRANTIGLKPEASNIELTERGFIKVDDRLETSCPGVYAIGDVTGQPAFTHVSWEDHRRILSILDGGDRRQGDRVLGYAFYTEPEAGRCGITLEEAKSKGLNARTVRLELEHVARAWLLDRTRGYYRLVVDNDSDLILGATLIGPRAGDLVHVLLDLMEAGVSWRLLEQSVHIHPTFAEGLPTVARMLLDK